MNKILLASTAALVLSAGYAAAEVTVTGDGRMGILEGFDFVDEELVDEDDEGLPIFDEIDTDDIGFTSRIRIRFAASGETDGGLTFGGSIRADNSGTDDGGGDVGEAGSVFISGAFGRLSMGDVSGAAEQAVGDVSGVGLTGLGDFNENFYIANSGRGARPAATYEYTTGDLTFYVSADNPQSDEDESTAYGVGAKYTFNNFTLGAGYEDGATTFAVLGGDEIDVDATQWIVGATAGFGDITVKATYGSVDRDDGDDFEQYAVSGDYVFGATTVTAFYRRIDVDAGSAFNTTAYGLGASYDLGGGAALRGGIVKVDSPIDGTFIEDPFGGTVDLFVPTSGDEDTAFDFGVVMSF